jgi:hypothetical protein
VLVALVAGCGGATAPRPRPLAALGPDHLRYDLRLTHRPGTLAGDERIAFRNPFTRPLTHVWVRAWANAFGSCARPRATLTALDGARVGARRAGCTAQRLDLPRPVAPGASGSVHLALTVAAPPRFDRFGRLGRTDFFGNALPTLAVSRAGAEPSLPPYSFLGESFFTLTAAWRVQLRTQPGEQVAATGTRSGDTLTAPAERDFMLVIGPMRERDARAAGIRVRWWVPRGQPYRYARFGVRMAAQSLAALQRRLGPYGAPELDAVQTPAQIAVGGIAMEYPQLILSPAYRPAVSHEVAHQWFYRLVGDDEFHDPWVDETLAEYTAVRLGRALHGPDRERGCATRDRTPRPPAPVDSDMGTLARLQRHRAHVVRDTLYVEGPCGLFDITRATGARRMDAFWRALVARYRGRVLSGPDLAAQLRALPGGPRALRAMRIR